MMEPVCRCFPLSLPVSPKVSNDRRGKDPLYYTKTGAHSWSSCTSRSCFFFAPDVVPNTAGAAQGAAEQTRLRLPEKKRMEWRNWSGAFADAPVLVQWRLEISNYRCENRIPQMVSLVNPFFRTFLSSCVFSRFSTFCPKKWPLYWKKTHLLSIAIWGGSCYYRGTRFCGWVFIFIYSL